MRRYFLVGTAAILLTGSAVANEASPWHIVYEHPEAPETSWFTVLELPSYLFMPGAPIGGLGYRMAGAEGSTATVGGGDLLNCSDVTGPVPIYGSDPNHLDADHDGVGCE